MKFTSVTNARLAGGSQRVVWGAGLLALGGFADCRRCPRRARCTTAKVGRTLRLHPHHDLLRAARLQAAAPKFQDTYRQHRPRAERSIAWLVRKGRRCPYRGTQCNRIWLTTRAAAVDLQRLANLGLAHNGHHWALN